MAVDNNNEAIGYKFVRVGKMLEDIRHGVDPKEAYEKNIGTYGRYADAPKYICLLYTSPYGPLKKTSCK